MSALALLRAEIKAWERAFADTHARDPSVQDIRAHPDIATKYKLYKKLSKPPPSTPPRTPSRLPEPKARAAEPVPPRPGFTPFSPAKPTPVASSSHALTAVSRARKRLRGDPVSPSPNKPKRQRVRSHALDSDEDSSASDHDTDGQLPLCDLASFVADSPVKAPAGGKSFKLLFDDALPSLPMPRLPVASPGSAPSLFEPSANLSSKGFPSASARSRVFPAPTQPHKPAFREDPQPRTSSKRTLDAADPQLTVLQCPLVPPSPPPQDSIDRDAVKGKTKATASRKKPRVDDPESDDQVDAHDTVTLKVATVSLRQSKRSAQHAHDLDWDPLLHLGARKHDPAVEEQNDANRHADGTFSISLPDKFRRVLAISPSQSQNSEERVVHGLLYGLQTGHYDPSRGGDIWDAGENPATEDDWESEPVPWEVGEL